MIVVTTDDVHGMEVKEVLGMVRGSAVRARGIGYDITAAFKNVVGGRVTEYTNLLKETREEATTEMIGAAEELGADAITCTRYTTSSVGQGFAEILAYGTAVKLM